MTKYEYLMNKADECGKRALDSTDVNLKKFYSNASIGFTKKARDLTVDQAGAECPVVNAGEREALLRGL